MEDSFVLQLKNRKFPDFYLCFCGYAKCAPLHSFGPAVRPNYIIHLILDGKGIYRVGKQQYELSAGEGFLIRPEISTFYQADPNDPWTYMWVGFDGSRAEEYLSDIGLGGDARTFHCSCTSELKRMLVDALKRNTSTIENDFYRESFLYSFFGMLAGSLNPKSASGDETDNLYVRRAVEFIQNNYHYGIRVSDVADYAGVTRGYLHTLFTRFLDQSPQDYLVSYRITRAEQLLALTDLTVEGVAQSCGYSDPLVFSKLFKKRTGQTPSAFRRENWERTKSELSGKQDRLDQI